MAEEKMACPKCACPSKKYTLFGILAIVYGVMVYMMDIMGWQPYMAWVAGGVILLLVSWAKRSMKG
jgi:hypothetical protein